MKWRIALLMIFAVSICSARTESDSPTSIELQQMDENFWIVLNDLPLNLQPETLYQLYTFLKVNVQVSEDSPFIDAIDNCPAVLRFVDDLDGLTFPDSAEGFAGLADFAEWRCEARDDSEKVSCQFFAVDDETPEPDRILLAVVNRNLERKEMIGVTAHELAHLVGAVDGPRCPTHEAYNPLTRPEIDYSDTYWWYGAVGVFTYIPQGIVWDALNERCDECESSEICLELETILASSVEEQEVVPPLE